jgi:hypothetical protein
MLARLARLHGWRAFNVGSLRTATAMSESYCDVSLGDYDGDAATFYHEEQRKARKSHTCHECGASIAAGQTYRTVVGKWDGEVNRYSFCEPCWEIMGEFSENGRTFGVTWDTFADEWNNGATLQGCLNRLSSAAAKEHMRQQWLKLKRTNGC